MIQQQCCCIVYRRIKGWSGVRPKGAHLRMDPEPDDHRPATARRMEVLPAPLAPVMSSDRPWVTCGMMTCEAWTA